MHPYLPTWMRGAFEIRRDGPAVALVRRDFAPLFGRLGLIRDAGLSRSEDDGRARGGPEAGLSGTGGDATARPNAGGRGVVRIVAAGALGEAVIRPCRRGGLPGRFVRRRYLLGNRAFEELIVTEELRWRGVPVAEPLAAVQRRRWPGYVACVVTRRLPGALPLSRLLAPPTAADPPSSSPALPGAPPQTPERCAPARLLHAAGRAVGLLHRAGGWHADLNAGNLVIDPRDPELRASVLDLDRGRVLPAPVPAFLARRNLRRLRRSLSKLGLEDGLAAWPAFQEGYAQGPPEGRGHGSVTP